ncbi:hypothetical protein FBU31_002131, partial [Coemansia sp. 'formosensis']
TQDEYSTLDSVLRTSKSLIQSLEQADALDRWLMLGGLVLFALVVFNILRKRIWIPGLSTLFSLIRYLVLSVVGRAGTDTAVSTSSPLVTQQLVVVATSTTISELSTTLVTSLAALVSESVLVAETTQVAADLQLFTLDTSSSTGSLEEETHLIEPKPQDIQEYNTADDTQMEVVTDEARVDEEARAEEQGAEGLAIQPEESIESAEKEDPEEPLPRIDPRKIYTLPVERPAREEL